MIPAAVILISLAAAVLWCAALAAGGSRARAVTRLPLPPALRLPVDFLIGAWVTASLALVCGLAGVFRPAALVSVTIVCALLGKWRGNGWKLWPLLLIGAPCALLVPIALAPPFFYDALVYHLGLPWQALMEGRLSPHPENLFAAFPPLAQLVYAAPISIGLDRIPSLLHLASFVAAGAALAALSRRLGASSLMATLAGATLPILPAVALVPALPAAEGWLLASLLCAFGIAFAGKGGQERGACATHVLAGFLCGIACASRLQGIAWSVILLLVIAARSRRLSALMRAAVGWLVGSAPWWMKNLVLLGDPLAPLGWHREGIETLWRDAGSQLHLASGVTGLLHALSEAVLPHLAYVGPLAMAAILAVATGRNRRSNLVAGAVLAGTIAWAVTGTLPRFLAPTLALVLALASAAGARSRTGVFATDLALVTAMVLGLVFTAQQMNRWGGFGLALEESTVGMTDLVTNNPAAIHREALHLPVGAKVLFVGEARGFGFPRRFIAPSQHDISPLRDPIESLPSAEAVRAWLTAQGYTHLLVNVAELRRLAPSYPVAPWRSEAGEQRFGDLLRLLAPPEIRGGETAIYGTNLLRLSRHHGQSWPN